MITERDFLTASILGLSERFLKRNGHPRFNGVDSGKKKERSDLRPIVSSKDPDSEQAEAFRTLRTSISLLGKDAQFRSILFTSAIPAEGKTFTSLNFAVSLAQQRLMTLVIDADMR